MFPLQDKRKMQRAPLAGKRKKPYIVIAGMSLRSWAKLFGAKLLDQSIAVFHGL
jgi:hypothetical protein